MIHKYDLVVTGYINVISQLKVKIHNGSFQTKQWNKITWNKIKTVPAEQNV